VHFGIGHKISWQDSLSAVVGSTVLDEPSSAVSQHSGRAAVAVRNWLGARPGHGTGAYFVWRGRKWGVKEQRTSTKDPLFHFQNL